MKFCAIKGCSRKYSAIGLCDYHYTIQWRKNHPEKWKASYDRANKIQVEKKGIEYFINRTKEYRKTYQGKLQKYKDNKKYDTKHPKRRKAHVLARIIPLAPCIKCGNPKAHRHHPDINKPLQVIMLCPKHHVEAHKQM